ncbi:MAG TPA: hypothetical protein VFC79_00750 [Tissierellaceae bacterium]|nr:hypothetical protein [Tissierellaceae bacterium]
MWTEKEIKNLRKFAHNTFQTEIPLSVEIEKIQLFVSQSKMGGYKDMGLKLIKTNNIKLQWIPNFWTFPMEVEIPESIMGTIRTECENLLDVRCDELAKLCGYRNEMTAEQ